MNQKHDAERRRALGAIASLPMLPLAMGTLSSALLAARATAAKPAQRVVQAVSFTGMAAPSLANKAAMATMGVESAMSVHYSDNSRANFGLAYQSFFTTGDRVPDGNGGLTLAGGYYDIKNQPIVDLSVPTRARQFFSDCPDGMSLLKLEHASVPGVQGNTVFAVVQFEYTTRDQSLTKTYSRLPSPIAVLTLDQNPATGALSLVKYHNVDTSGVHGLWITCGASLSPWNTHLSSEEYEPDAFAISSNAPFAAFSKSLYGGETTANPYHYGHVPEVTVNSDGSGSVKKHYCMGRLSHELVQVMPDERTVLMGDDATNGGAFMFIADRARDLSSGTLYVAKWNQTSGVGPGSATLSWIKLGSAASAEIEAMIDSGLQATDIMDVHATDPSGTLTAKLPHTKIPYAGKFNWIKLKPGMNKAAAFLETHRYAALMGGSMGFTKWEGTTVNAKDKVAYVAMSRIESSMLNGSGDIRVEGPYSGAVYAQNLRSGQVDSSGAAIDSEWVPVDMAAIPALISEDFGGKAKSKQDALGNFANPDKIATPDNLKFSEKLRTLFIGEDSDTHVNNFLWAYNVDSKTLSRLLSCPAGAESTGLHAADDINGWMYITSNFQHAGDWESPLHDIVKPVLDPLIRTNYKDRFGASVGYLTGLPRLG